MSKQTRTMYEDFAGAPMTSHTETPILYSASGSGADSQQ